MSPSKSPDPLHLDTDVLVLGGGPAALWAALTAAQEGARVVLADKGFAGSSGVAAAATAGHWWVPPDPAARREAAESRNRVGGDLSDPDWMHGVMEETWRRFPELADDLAYPSPLRALIAGSGTPQPVIEGPIYLRALRRRTSRTGVRILDHSPALELLVDDDGTVVGAAGVRRQKEQPWRITARATILATGGCSYKSGSLGSNVNTGDGLLMGAEVGVGLSGMEFSSYYGIVPVGASMDKNGLYFSSTFTDADGAIVAEGWNGGLGALGPHTQDASLIRAGLRGPVYSILDRAPQANRAAMRAGMPNYFMAFDRLGIDPFTQRFEIEFVSEGTVRGTGGLLPADRTCWTGVPGLWAAGDTLSRERIVGGASGAGSANASFTIASGTWAGTAAAAHAAAAHGGGDGQTAAQNGRDRSLTAEGAGRVGLRPTGTSGPSDAWREFTVALQDEVLPVHKNGVRTEPVMAAAQSALDELWAQAGASLRGAGARDALAAREAAAMIAVGRWGYASARARTESRVMHVRDDFPELDPGQRHRILTGGLERVWTDRELLPTSADRASALVA